MDSFVNLSKVSPVYVADRALFIFDWSYLHDFSILRVKRNLRSCSLKFWPGWQVKKKRWILMSIIIYAYTLKHTKYIYMYSKTSWTLDVQLWGLASLLRLMTAYSEGFCHQFAKPCWRLILCDIGHEIAHMIHRIHVIPHSLMVKFTFFFCLHEKIDLLIREPWNQFGMALFNLCKPPVNLSLYLSRAFPIPLWCVQLKHMQIK